MYMGVQMKLFQTLILFPSDAHPDVELRAPMGVPCFMSGGTSILVSTVAAPICTPTNSALGFPFLYIIANTYFLLFDSNWVII